MGTVTVWTGPVNHTQNGDIKWPDSSAIYVPCTGDGSGGTLHCSDPSTIRKVVEACQREDVAYGAAFSAGGMTWERAIPQIQNLSGLMLADGTYSDFGPDGKTPSMALAEQRIQFLASATINTVGAKGPIALYMSSSSPNGNKPTGSQTLREIARTAEEKHGVTWMKMGAVFLISGRQVQAETWSSERALLIDFGSSFTHTQMVTEVAPAMWPVFIDFAPGIADIMRSGTTPELIPELNKKDSKTPWIVGGVVSTLAAIAGAMYWWKKGKGQSDANQ